MNQKSLSTEEIPLEDQSKEKTLSKSEDILATKSKNTEKTKKRRKKGNKYIYVNVTQAYYPLIQEALESIGYKTTESATKANLFWINQNGSTDTAASLLPYQFYNHFPGTVSISRKVDLAKNIELVAKTMPEEYSFHPKSFILPSQYIDMKNYMLSIKKPKKRTFIVKPDKGSLGKGIFLVQDPTQCCDYCEPAIAQKYIDPYLIDDLKFDLRIYVLVTSIDPLRVYVYKEGMARFCTEKYQDPSPDNLEHVFCHLTNYSLNKKNENFQANTIVIEESETEEKGHKRSMTSIFESIRKNGHDVEKLKHEIDEIIRLTMAAAQMQIASQYRIGITSNDGKSRCFEILGFDIMIDNNCKPWLLEVNNKPSMAAESPFDHELKMSVIQSAMKVIDLNCNFKKLIGQRFQELACAKFSAQRTPSLADYEGETERAKETKWKQLYPLLPGEESCIEKAIDEARVANGYKPRKPEEKKPPQIPQEQAPQRTLPIKRNSQIKVQSQRVFTQPREQQQQQLQQQQPKPTPPPKVLKKNLATKSFPQHHNVIPNQQQIIVKPVPTSSLTAPPQQNTSSHLYPRQVSTPKKKVVCRTAAINDPPLIKQMHGFPPETINEMEEKERLKRIRARETLAKNQNFFSKINAITHITKQPQQPPVPFTEAATIRANRNLDSQNSKRGLYKSFRVDGALFV